MEVEHQMRTIRYKQAVVAFETLFLSRVQFTKERGNVHHDTTANKTNAFGVHET